MSERVIIRNGWVVTMNDAGDVLPDGAVVLDGDRITDVGETAGVLARHSTDAETAFALQGLGAGPIVQAGTPESSGLVTVHRVLIVPVLVPENMNCATL